MSDFLLTSDIEEIVNSFGADANALAGKTILLTGGRGFLGRYFTEVFASLNSTVLEEPCKVVVIDNLITAGEAGAKVTKNENMEFIELLSVM